MRRFRRGIALMCVLALVGGLLACSSQEAEQGDSKDRKYTITSIDFLYTDIPPKDGRGVEMINERFNVDYQREYVVYTEYVQKLTARVASGDIPDVIGFEGDIDKTNFFKWAKQGAFLPLNDYIDDYPT